MSDPPDPRPFLDDSLEERGLDALIRLIFESSHLGMAISSLDTRWGWVNRRFCELLEYSAEELKGKTWVDLTHPDDVGADMALYVKLLAGELDEYELEKRFITASGGILSAHMKVVCSRNPDRSVQFVWAYLQDLSERSEVERELRRRLDLERTIASVASKLAGTSDLDQAICSALEDIGRMGGASRAYVFRIREREALMDNTHEWCSPGAPTEKANLQGIPLELHTEVVRRLRLGQAAHIRDLAEIPEKARKERDEYERQGIRSLLALPIMVRGSLAGFVGFDSIETTSPWSDADVTLLRLFSGVLGGALERKEAVDRVRFSQQRFREVIDLVPDFIFAKDQNGRYMLVNKAMARAYGTTPKEMVGKTDEVFVDSEEDRNRYLAEDQEVLQSGRRKDFPASAFTDKDGNLRMFRTVKIPFTFSGMEAPSILAVASEVTELVQTEARRRRLERSLLDAQRLESLGILAGGIAHDFNNLLLAILGNLDLALQDLPAHSPAYPLLDQAMQASRRATELTRQMLAYSGRSSFKKVRVDLNETVRENADLFRTAVGGSVTFVEDLPDEPAFVEADPGQLQQVVMNLITNASEAVGEGKGTVRLSTGVRRFEASELARNVLLDAPEGASFAFIRVQDDGVGMDEETRRRVFDPFFSTKFTGRGLGMAAVLGIVRGHDGAILVESEPGQGTTIQVLFPTLAVPEEGSETSAYTPESPLSFQGTVLVADDEPMVLRIAERQLLRLGFDVITAEDGEEAVERVRERGDEMTAIMMDMTMPRLDGLEAVRQIRLLYPTLPILLCSGYDNERRVDHLREEGGIGFAQKPFRLEDLREAFGQLLT